MLPEAQAVHIEAPEAVATVSNRQDVQAVAPAAEYWPAAQEAQVVVKVPYWPLRHWAETHVTAPSAE